MKKDKWSAIKVKYFEGLSSIAEEEELKKNTQDPYFQALKDESESAMDLDFDRFMEQASTAEGMQTGVIEGSKSTFSIWWKYAAAIAALFLAALLWYSPFKVEPVEKQSLGQTAISLPSTGMKKHESQIKTNRLPEAEPTVKLAKRDAKKVKTSAAVILPEEIAQEPLEEAYVLVNGKAITDRTEAEAITRSTLALMASNIQEGRSALEKIKYISVEL